MTEQTKFDDVKPEPVPPELAGKTLLSGQVVVEGPPQESRKRDEAERHPDPGPATAFAADEHTYIRDYIALADQKAGSLFAILAAMLAYLQVQGATRPWSRPFHTWSFVEYAALLASIGLLVGALLALLVVVPRIGGARQGLVFWEAVASFPTGEDYAAQVAAADPRRLLLAKLEHCYELAGVCRRKYRMLTAALWCGGVGLAASLAYLAFAARTAATGG